MLDVLLKILAFCSHETKKFDLDEKMNVTECASKNPKLGYWVVMAHITLEKSVSNILKNLKTLQKEYEVLKVVVKKMRNGQ